MPIKLMTTSEFLIDSFNSSKSVSGTLLDFNLSSIFDLGDIYIFNYFINYSYIDSKYTNSDIPGVVNKRVEFVPKNNLKTGLRFGFKDFINLLIFVELGTIFVF
mgnify:CR=1 FL=1